MATAPTWARTSLRRWAALIILLVVAVSTQVALEGMPAPSVSESVSWVRSPTLMRRLTLGFSDLWADVYWIRAVQYYGGIKLSKAENKNYDSLYPLLDITTSLDPRFNIAYRLGAILLSEGYPSGAGNPDQAIALLEKGLRAAPEKWQYAHDAGFVYYWWRRDPAAAAQWFLKASEITGAPNWLRPVAASMLTEGGDREPARRLWQEMATTAEHQWLRESARRGLMQIDAEEHLEVLQRIVNEYRDRAGRFPATWHELIGAGIIRQSPVDPSGYVYALDPDSGAVDVAPGSRLYPLRRR
jgi:tetratricopeptide (TPR) repeat protein